MKTAPVHAKEEERLEALQSKNLLDTVVDPVFDAITEEATAALDVPMSTITLVDREREWFKSCVGLDERQGPRDISFCGHALVERDVLICPDTLEDEIFKDNPYVIGKPYIRFYAGMRLLDLSSGLPIGVFCVKDIKPRNFSVAELGLFMDLASRAEALVQ